MKKIFFISVLLLTIATTGKAQKRTDIPIPSQAQLNWQNAELVAVFHYDLQVSDGENYNDQKNRVSPIQDYNIFSPDQLDTDQ